MPHVFKIKKIIYTLQQQQQQQCGMESEFCFKAKLAWRTDRASESVNESVCESPSLKRMICEIADWNDGAEQQS